jgi:formate hydrogenlyase subunit 4
LSDILTNHQAINLITVHGTSIFLIGASLFLVMLSETCRVPFDDPNTHLELTMIHEAMILDNSGPDLAYILYGASLKLWLFASLIVMILIPFSGPFWLNIIIFLAAMALIAVLIGIVESTIARFRFIKIPQLLVGALGLTVLAVIFSFVINGKGL